MKKIVKVRLYCVPVMCKSVVNYAALAPLGLFVLYPLKFGVSDVRSVEER